MLVILSSANLLRFEVRDLRSVLAFGRAEPLIKAVWYFSLRERKIRNKKNEKCHAAAGQSAKGVPHDLL